MVFVMQAVGALLAVAVLTAVCVLRWIRRNITIVRVLGTSMSPTYRDGEKVIARRVRATKLRRGDVAVLNAATGPSLMNGTAVTHLPVIKRVAALPGDVVPKDIHVPLPEAEQTPRTVPDGCLLVLGDNAERSVDSRAYGFLALDAVEGKVVRKVREARWSAPPPSPIL
jgi:signal peptidase I